MQSVPGKVGDRRSADDTTVVLRSDAGDLNCMKSLRSSEIYESLRLDRQRTNQQAERDVNTMIAAVSYTHLTLPTKRIV